jgi:hypothetical protein
MRESCGSTVGGQLRLSGGFGGFIISSTLVDPVREILEEAMVADVVHAVWATMPIIIDKNRGAHGPIDESIRGRHAPLFCGRLCS